MLPDKKNSARYTLKAENITKYYNDCISFSNS